MKGELDGGGGKNNGYLLDRFTHECLLVNRSIVRHLDRPVPKMLNFFSCGSTASGVFVSW